jgi:hypothetical protein
MNAARVQGWVVRVQDPTALAAGSGRFAFDLPNVDDESDARAAVEAFIHQIPRADTLFTVFAVGGGSRVAPLDGCRAKLDRAAEHLDSLRPEYDAWFGDGRDIIETVEADEPASDGGPVWLVSRCARTVREPPARWGLVVGDALHNMRAALDHLACRLVELAGNSPSLATAFPIWDRDPYANRDDERRFERVLAGMRPGDAEAIRRLQPYQDPTSEESAKLIALAALNNLDKHLLILPVLINFHEEIPLTTWTVTGSQDDVELIVNRGAQITPGVELARARTRSGRPEMGVNIGFELAIGYGPADPPTRLAELREIRSYAVAIIESFGLAFG